MEEIDLAQVRKFIEYERARFDLDRKAIKEARQMAGGDSWRESFNAVKTTLRHKVRVDAVNQIINKICSKFTSNPFRFISGNEQLQLDYNSYDTAIALAFRDCVTAGQGFILCDFSSGRAERLDAGSVIMDGTGRSSYVVCVEKEPRESGGWRPAGDNLGLDTDIIPHNPETERLAFIVYRKTANGIAAAKVVDGEIAQSEILPISEYPVIRIAAEESWIENRLTYRGLYHKAQGVSDLIDVTFSKIASNVLTAPRMKYWVPDVAASSEAFHKSMSEMHKADTAYAVYPAFDEQGRPLPPPHRDESRLFVEELVAITDKMVSYINMLFGFEASENADTGNKTAQEILFRKENQNANYSQYLFNLSAAIGAVCKIYESLGREKVSIVSGPYENIYRQTSQQAILAINDYCTAQPQRALVAPLLIKFSSLDERTKAELNEAIRQQTNVQQLLAQSEQMQSQLRQLQSQNQQLAQTANALKQQQLTSGQALEADLAKEQMKYADKAEERAFESAEAEKDRAVELFKTEIDNPVIEAAAAAASDLNPAT
jgi:hypothetical protein